MGGGGGGGEEEISGGNFWVNPRVRLDETGDRGRRVGKIGRGTRARRCCRRRPEQRRQGELCWRRKRQRYCSTSALSDSNSCSRLCLLYIYNIN